MSPRLVTAAKTLLPFAFLAVLWITHPDARTTMLFALLGYYGALAIYIAIAKVSLWNYNRKAPQREAASYARTHALVEEHFAARSQPFVWEDWDGPHMVAGQPR